LVPILRGGFQNPLHRFFNLEQNLVSLRRDFFKIPLASIFTIEQAFGGWAKADKDHFADGGSFDRIYTRK
jgi:ABC-type sulfate transport system substrate-binding protein